MVIEVLGLLFVILVILIEIIIGKLLGLFHFNLKELDGFQWFGIIYFGSFVNLIIDGFVFNGFFSDKLSEILERTRVRYGVYKKISYQNKLKRNKRTIKSPEERFKKPKRVDWDRVNKKNRELGFIGEDLVVNIERKYFNSIGRADLADKVRHVSLKDGDGLGFDVLSFFSDGNEKYIEVKTTTKDINSKFFISKSELNFLREHLNSYFVYRVCIHKKSGVWLSVYSGKDFFNNFVITPIQYSVDFK